MWIKRLNRVWRLFATAISFLVFGSGGLLFGIVVFPLTFVFVRNPNTRKGIARRFVSNAFIFFRALMSGLGILSYEIKGSENAVIGQNQIIIANHPMLIDVVFLVSLFPMADCVIKEAITKNLFLRSVVSSTDYIPSGNTGILLKTCVRRLKSGASLLLFPEGTRTVPGEALDFKLGAASFAVKAEAEVLPVTIQCDQPRFLSKNEPWYWIPAEKPFVSIRIYPSQTLDELIPANVYPNQATRDLNQAFLDFFNSKLG